MNSLNRNRLVSRLLNTWSEDMVALQVSAVALMCLGVVMIYSAGTSLTGRSGPWPI